MTPVFADLPTTNGHFRIDVFTDDDGQEHIVLAKGEPRDGCLIRIHSECATGDVLGSLRCDCRAQLEKSLALIEAEGEGILIYLRGHEGRGIGLANKIRAYALQEQGLDTYEANTHLGFAPDQRSYKAAIDILKEFGLKKVRLLTNNTDKIEALRKAGIEVESVALWLPTNSFNEKYIETKRRKMAGKR